MRKFRAWQFLGTLALLSALFTSCNARSEPTQSNAKLSTPTIDLANARSKLSLTDTARALAATARAPTATRPPATSTPYPYADTSTAPVLSFLRIVFVRDGNIFIIDRSLPEVQLTFSGMDGDVAISKDGNWIAFRRWVSLLEGDEATEENPLESELRIMDNNGDFQEVLLSVEELDSLFLMTDSLERGGVHPHEMQFIPGSDLIIFKTFTWEMRGPSHHDLHVVDVKTGHFNSLLAVDEAITATISPDGKYIAAASGTGVHIIDVNSLTIRENIIPHGFYRDGPPWVTFVYPEWSPDSSYFVIAVESERVDGGDWAYGNQIWKIYSRGSPPELLSSITTIYLQTPYDWPLNAKISLQIGRMYYACPDPNNSPAWSSPPNSESQYLGVQLCFSDLDGENTTVYPFPNSPYSDYPFQQEGFPSRSNLIPGLSEESWVDGQFWIGIWRNNGLVLIQSEPPHNIFLLAAEVDIGSAFGFTILE